MKTDKKEIRRETIRKIREMLIGLRIINPIDDDVTEEFKQKIDKLENET
jgi:hypothetical protein